MFNFKNFSKVTFLLIGVAMFASSCGSDMNTNGLAKTEDVAKLEKKVDQLSQQIGELTSTAIPTTTLINTTVPETVPPATLDLEQMDADALDFCLDYQVNFDQKMVDQGIPAGAFFNGSCYSDRWGAVYAGMPGDTWVVSLRGAVPGYTNGVALTPFDTSDGTVPAGKKHPVYTDAITIEEMVPGTVVCRMYGTESLGTFVVSGLVLESFESSDFIMAGWTHSGDGTWSLEDDGVIPYQDGTWAVSRLTRGPCSN